MFDLSEVTRSELEKLKATYRQLSRDASNTKEKYREALVKGPAHSHTPAVGGGACPRALRQSNSKAPQPPHQYVLAVCGAQTQQDEHRRHAAPALLDALQRMQEDMTLALRSILEEYCDISSLLSEEIVRIHQEISAAVQQIDPLASISTSSTPTDVHICVFRSPESPEPNVEFDTSLLEETETCRPMRSVEHADGRQPAGHVVIATEELTLTQQNLRTKRRWPTTWTPRSRRVNQNAERRTSDCVLLLSQKLSLLELRHAVQSLRSSEARLASQKALLDAKMAAAATSPPPPPPPPALPYEDDARSVGSTDKKERSSRLDTLRHSLAGMIRSPKAMLGSSSSFFDVIPTSERPLAEQEWYHGAIPRTEAQELLRQQETSW
ncbi:hypothetical protein INR49_008187 [Caranx melampygus]|nr:hypothetical protein INR49_008187 [Caranx melampygus]